MPGPIGLSLAVRGTLLLGLGGACLVGCGASPAGWEVPDSQAPSAPPDSGTLAAEATAPIDSAAGQATTLEGGPGPIEAGPIGASIDAGAADAADGAESGRAAASDAAPLSGKTEYAPYVYVGTPTGAFGSLVDLQRKAGLNEVTLAFVLSGGNCSTDGTIAGRLGDIKAFVAKGGHVKASFGGAGGTYVDSDCGDATSFAAAISDFVDATGITDLDFDVEQPPALTQAANAMRGQALKMVQDSKNIQVSFTLEGDPSPNGGLNSDGISVVTEAVAAGVRISHVNLMVMDFGDMAPGTPLAPLCIGSLTDGNAELMKIIPGLTTEQAWAMLGATPDIGQNDDREVFSLADARALAAFAMANKLGLMSFWSLERDQVCGYGLCSGYNGANFDYNNIFKAVAR
jgi:chitinase